MASGMPFKDSGKRNRGMGSFVRTVAALLLVIELASVFVVGKIEHLKLKRDRRRYVVISTFGMLESGSITLKFKQMKFRGHIGAAGFSIHRSTERAAQYQLGPENAREHGECFISHETEESQATDLMRVHMNISTGWVDRPIEEHLSGLRVEVGPPQTELEKDPYYGWFLDYDDDMGFYWDDEKDKWAEPPPTDADRTQEIRITLQDKAHEDLYSIALHHCNEAATLVGSIDFDVEITEMNAGPEYLGAGLAPVPNVYFFMAAMFAGAAIVWVMILRDAHNDESKTLFKIHYLMLVLCLMKCVSLICHGIDYHFIGKDGTRNEAWAVAYYGIHLLKGVILFLAILLIGVGFGFIKHALSKNERMIFYLVIPLQVFANIASIMIEESAEGSQSRSTWRSLGLLVDLICCGAILFPVVWSIRHLRESSEVDGKAQTSLVKLRLFRRFYVMVLAYVYTTRIIIYLVESTVPFRWEWMGALFSELTAFAFYITTGYMFSPEEDNVYLHCPTDSEDEESFEMEPATTNMGLSEGLVHKKRGANAEPVAPSKPDPKTIDAAKQKLLEPDF
jgi:hypothetical protein